MRIVFMGSSEASAVTLRALLRAPQVEVVGVVTQPDRPSGRRQRFTPCPCKAFAVEKNVSPIITPEKVNAPEVLAQIERLKPDVIVVVAFGQFLGSRLLALPPYGCINGHFSLLPKYRGAAPVQAAIASGDEVTGVTVMQMAAGMDDGDMLLKAIEPICSDDTAVTLMERLAILGAVTMVKALRLMIAGKLTREPQDHAQATYAPKMQKADGQIDWSLPASLIERRTRAYEPWPGAFTFLPARAEKGAAPERIKILQAEVVRESVAGYEQAAPGTVCLITPVGPLVTTGDGLLCLTAVQPDGGRRMDGKSFLNGHPLVPGDRFCSVL
ncbi:MAG TPA: methionyl-tRNA formyltransferase [Kiritimatiellia bacterium]|mgnify:FL=1|nr:methionyl-tRNA formyltransferase [Kiritimatiellia bacterium]HRU71854.1 methionyl-tRNA formyltransferase [Kiritimatiellia bacterium]